MRNFLFLMNIICSFQAHKFDLKKVWLNYSKKNTKVSLYKKKRVLKRLWLTIKPTHTQGNRWAFFHTWYVHVYLFQQVQIHLKLKQCKMTHLNWTLLKISFKFANKYLYTWDSPGYFTVMALIEIKKLSLYSLYILLLWSSNY